MAAVVSDAAQDVSAMFDAHGKCVRHYLAKRCNDPELADELTAETFACAFVSLQRLTAPRADLQWLLGIATHKLADHWRRESREQRKFWAAVDQWHNHDRGAAAAVDTSRVQQVLEELDPQHRLVLLLRYQEQLSVREIASVVQRSVHGTESLLARARRSFKTSYAVAN
jgi:RNA polymerase sigma-70 factor (ECF subfamily)